MYVQIHICTIQETHIHTVCSQSHISEPVRFLRIYFPLHHFGAYPYRSFQNLRQCVAYLFQSAPYRMDMGYELNEQQRPPSGQKMDDRPASGKEFRIIRIFVLFIVPQFKQLCLYPCPVHFALQQAEKAADEKLFIAMLLHLLQDKFQIFHLAGKE